MHDFVRIRLLYKSYKSFEPSNVKPCDRTIRIAWAKINVLIPSDVRRQSFCASNHERVALEE